MSPEVEIRGVQPSLLMAFMDAQTGFNKSVAKELKFARRGRYLLIILLGSNAVFQLLIMVPQWVKIFSAAAGKW